MTDHTNDTHPIGLGDRRARGKQIRKTVPRSAHGDWTPAPDRLCSTFADRPFETPRNVSPANGGLSARTIAAGSEM